MLGATRLPLFAVSILRKALFLVVGASLVMGGLFALLLFRMNADPYGTCRGDVALALTDPATTRFMWGHKRPGLWLGGMHPNAGPSYRYVSLVVDGWELEAKLPSCEQ